MNNPIEIYFFKLSQGAVLKPDDWFDSIELLRFEKMSSAKRRSEFLASRFLMKSVLENFYHLKNPRILESKSGKPFVKGVKFNVSHSGNIIVLAVHREAELGIDIEHKKEKKFFLEVAKQYFHEGENALIVSTKSAKQQMKRFKQLWSLKEAYIKASGGRLNRQSMQIYFNLAQNKVIKAPTKRKFQFFYNEKLNLSLAVRSDKMKQPVCFDISFLKGKLVRKKKSGIRFSALSWMGKA